MSQEVVTSPVEVSFSLVEWWGLWPLASCAEVAVAFQQATCRLVSREQFGLPLTDCQLYLFSMVCI